MISCRISRASIVTEPHRENGARSNGRTPAVAQVLAEAMARRTSVRRGIEGAAPER